MVYLQFLLRHPIVSTRHPNVTWQHSTVDCLSPYICYVKCAESSNLQIWRQMCGIRTFDDFAIKCAEFAHLMAVSSNLQICRQMCGILTFDVKSADLMQLNCCLRQMCGIVSSHSIKLLINCWSVQSSLCLLFEQMLIINNFLTQIGGRARSFWSIYNE